MKNLKQIPLFIKCSAFKLHEKINRRQNWANKKMNLHQLSKNAYYEFFRNNQLNLREEQEKFHLDLDGTGYAYNDFI